MVLEIPAGPLAICQGFWYQPEAGGNQKYLYVGYPGDNNVEYVHVPEMLIDERGHNTMVCHGKYLNPCVLPTYSKLRDNELFYVGSFNEARRMKDSEGRPNRPVDGGSWSVSCRSWGDTKDAYFTYGSVVEFRGRIQDRFSYTHWRKDSKQRWYIADLESSHSEWKEKDPDDYGPWAAPNGHCGSVEHTDAHAIYDVNIGKLIDYTPKTFLSPRHFFRFSEPEVVTGKVQFSKDVQHSFLEAHLDAMSRFPKQADNDLANGIEVGKLIAAALLGNEDDAIEYFSKAVALPLAKSGKQAAKALGDMWMGYRYAYSTTKQDVHQRIDYLAREALYNNVVPKCYGQSTVSDRVVEAVVKHSFRALPNEADLMSTIRRRMYEGGVMPSLYKGWDLVPFSFVCDWFGDIGNYFEGLEGIHHAREYIYSESCYSLKYDLNITIEGVPQTLQMYTRVYMLPPLDDTLWNYFDYSYKSARGATVKTKLKRAGDVGALSLNFL
jgi:hypothetical protein